MLSNLYLFYLNVKSCYCSVKYSRNKLKYYHTYTPSKKCSSVSPCLISLFISIIPPPLFFSFFFLVCVRGGGGGGISGTVPKRSFPDSFHAAHCSVGEPRYTKLVQGQVAAAGIWRLKPGRVRAWGVWVVWVATGRYHLSASGRHEPAETTCSKCLCDVPWTLTFIGK